MINKTLEKLVQLNFFNFCTIYFGFKSELMCGYIPIELVKEYATEELKKVEINDEYQKLIVDVLISDNKDELLGCLQNINSQKCSESISKKMWLIADLYVLIDSLNPDPIYGLIELTNFWVKWNAEDCPHIFQGVNNEITPREYYSAGNFNFLFKRHLTWLEGEVNILSLLQK